MAGRIRKWLKDQNAGGTVEFVALMPVFLLTTVFAMEVSIAVFWDGTAEKAAQLGARMAIVSSPAVTMVTTCTGTGQLTSMPSTNCLDTTNANNVYGLQCTPAGGPCRTFAQQVCDGTAPTAAPCNQTNFNAIVSRMSGIWNQIQAQRVSITYRYSGLGYAGGPVVPSVTVTLSNIPLDGAMTGIFSRFFPGLTTLPPVSVTLTGEDLNTAGAS